MQLQIRHITHYHYDQPVDYALQKVRLHPQDGPTQDVLNWVVQVEGGKIEASYLDHYGNHVDLVRVDKGTQDVKLTASGQIKPADTAGILGKIYGRAPLWHFKQATSLTTVGRQIKALSKVIGQHEDPLQGLHALSNAVLKAAPYKSGKTITTTTAEQALGLGAGVCQDHTHIFTAAARNAGFPARYVSGYLMINEQIDQEASHAWSEVHLDTLGWVGFDVSNGVAPDNKYVRIAAGRDALDTAPITGMRMGSADESMIVSLQVQQ